MGKLTILRRGKREEVSFEGTPLLSNLLAEKGYFVPHPCGGRGTCGKCTVLYNGKSVLACRTALSGDGEVILPDAEEISSVTGAGETGKLTENLCLCLDIGTTTLALALVSLDEGAVIRTETCPNPQRAFGADVISRIDYCMKNGVGMLQKVLLQRVEELTRRMLLSFGLSKVERMYVAGNTTMLHLFFGVDCSSLGVSPYTPKFLAPRQSEGEDLGLTCVGEVLSLPGISAFVGADIVSGIHCVGLPEEGKWRILLDLGTNAEIALFSRDRILCTAAAAGPCFEGANISCGMSASEGAVCAVESDGSCTVIGGGEARGLCATGLIDAIAEAVRREDIDETGYLEEDPLPICGTVSLQGKDVREFQLAKSAICAGLECLVERANLSWDDVDAFYIAGGFSAGLKVDNAAFLGLFAKELAPKAVPVNNASLQGAVKFACRPKEFRLPLDNAEYADLSADPRFSELFMEYMMF